MATFTSKINGNDIYAKRAERTRSGVNLEAFTPEGGTKVPGILPEDLGTPGAADGSGTLATQKYVLDQMEVADALMYKGTVNSNADLPDGSIDEKKYKTGWTYKVATAGIYAGKQCEPGDMIIANKDWESGDTPASVWDVIQTNIDGAVTGPASVTADANIALFSGTTGKVIKDSQVAIETTLSASSDAKVPTSKAVNTAITSAVNALDATVNSTPAVGENTNVAVQVVEADGVITGVTITQDDTINATDLSTAINALDVSDLVQDTEGNKAGKTLLTLSETDGKIAATFQDISIVSSQISDKMSTYDGTGTDKTKVITGEGVKAAIDTLDVSNISGFGKGKTLATLTETDGKIAATFQDIEIVSDKVTDKQTTTFDGTAETLTTGKAVKAAIDALDATVTNSDKGVSITVVQTDGVLTSASVSAGLAGSTSATAGLMYYETVDL